jgi:hypothetical protein
MKEGFNVMTKQQKAKGHSSFWKDLFSSTYNNITLILTQFITGLTDARMQKIDSDIQCLIPIDVPVTLDTDQSCNIVKKLREFYLGNLPISEDTKAQYATVCILIFTSLL